MDISELFADKYVLGAIGGIGGVILTLITQQILQRRGLFTYYVNHYRLGVSEDNPIFGSIKVTWNESAVQSLYLSTIELTNSSTKDYDSVIVNIYTNNTNFLSEKTEMVGTPRTVSLTDDFTKRLEVPSGQQPTNEQIKLYSEQRDYIISVMNRGQIVRFQFLNAPKQENQPLIWVDILHKGVKLKFRGPQNQVLGVAQPQAALIGSLLGFLFVGVIIASLNSASVTTTLALIFGLFAQVPGALFIRAWRWLREFFGG